MDKVTEIEYDDIELSFIDNLGSMYKILDDIPHVLRHLVRIRNNRGAFR